MHLALVDQLLPESLRLQYLGTAQPLRVRLFLHRLARAAVDVNVCDLVAEDSDAPRLRGLVKGVGDPAVEALALEEELIQLREAGKRRRRCRRGAGLTATASQSEQRLIV